MVFRTSSDISSRQVLYEEGGTIRGFNMYIYNDNLYYGAWNKPNDGPGAPWGFYSLSTPINTNTSYILSFRYIGTSSSSGMIDCGLNGASIGTINNVGLIYNHSGGIAIAAKRGDTHFETASSGGTGHYFEGDIAEFIMLNYYTETATCHLMNNYLSAKYDIPLVMNDQFQHDDSGNGNFDHELAGIYRVSSSNLVTDAQGSGNVRLNNATDLDDNEFMMFAHDGQNYEGGNLFDVPGTVQARLERTWRIEEQGDVGLVDISFDLSNVSNVTLTDLKLLIDINNNGTFMDETVVGGGVIENATDEGNGIYKFSGVAGLADDTRFSLATINLFTTPLPIELLDFTGEKEDMSIRLDWSTLSEANTDYFHIERKTEEGEEWTSIGKVDAAGNSSTIQTYEYYDRYPVPGVSQYRLVQYDLDGTGEYVKTIGIPFTLDEYFTVYPNPPRDYLMITVKPDLPTTITLFNSSGDEITLPEESFYNYIKLDIAFLTPGLYIIDISQGGHSERKKVIVP